MENDKKKLHVRVRLEKKQKKVWTPPSHLMHPQRQTGYRHRWIRAELLGTMTTVKM